MRTHFWRGPAAAIAVCIALAGAVSAADDQTTEKKAVETKSPSVCVGLDINACGAKAECLWRKQITTKAGKVRRAHCRIRPYQQLAKKPA